MTNKELGQRIEVSPSMASRIRNGRRLPSVATLRRISRELNVPLDTLTDAHMDGAERFGELVREYLTKLDA